MPAVPLNFRAKCGCFVATFIAFMHRRAMNKVKIRTLKLHSLCAGVMVGLLLAQIFYCNLLQLCGDVELNPGPPKPIPQDQMRQTRLTSKSGESGGGWRESMDKSNSEPTLKDVMDRLASMDSNFDKKLATMDTNLERKLDSLKQEMNAAYTETREEVRELREEVGHLRKENENLKSRLDDIEMKADDLECRSRRNNLVFYGLTRPENETPQQCEDAVQDLLADPLGLPNPVEFDRVHRTSNKRDAPVVARCVFYKDRVNILKKAREKLKGSDVFVAEDFSARVRDIRKKLNQHRRAAKDSGKRATMVYDHLLIDGKKYVLDGEDSIKEVANAHAIKR